MRVVPDDANCGQGEEDGKEEVVTLELNPELDEEQEELTTEFVAPSSFGGVSSSAEFSMPERAVGGLREISHSASWIYLLAAKFASS